MHSRSPILLLLSIFFLGLDSMWGLIFRNGYYDALVHLRDFGPHLLPGSSTPIQQRYTGVGMLDYWLTVLQCVFANVTDGSAPHLSLYAFQFAGQLVSVLTVLMIESMREGNRRTIISLFLPWALAMQSVGYGVIMPLYGVIHLLTSPAAASNPATLAKQIQTFEDPELSTLPSSIIIGYVLPAVLMSLPNFSPKVHQYLVVVWQLFPIWVALLQYMFGLLYRYYSTNPRYRRHFKSGHNHSTELMMLHRAYIFAFTVSTVTHMASMLIIVCAKNFPSFFSNFASQSISFVEVFLPPNFHSHAQIKDMVQGAHNFFQYDQYIGSTAAIVWAVILHYNSRGQSLTTKDWLWLAFEIWGVSMISGPAAAFVTLMWNRDERVIEADEQMRDHENGKSSQQGKREVKLD